MFWGVGSEILRADTGDVDVESVQVGIHRQDNVIRGEVAIGVRENDPERAVVQDQFIATAGTGQVPRLN